MFYYIKWFFIIAFWVLVGAIFHYTLPQVDIARITDTESKRVNPGNNSLFWSSGEAGSASGAVERDVYFIQTHLANGKVMVYRNEDTGWIWPPYFKFDTSNLQTKAADLRSTANDPLWVAIRHYGWRFEQLSIYPNALRVWPVDGPDASKPFPWLNTLVLTGFVVVILAAWRRWRRFRKKHIDPKLEDWQDSWEATEDAIAERGGRLKRWWARQRRGY